MSLSPSLIKIDSALQWSEGEKFQIRNLELERCTDISIKNVSSNLESVNEPFLVAIGQVCVCWMPENVSRTDRMVYASSLVHIKNHFHLNSVKTVYSQEEFDQLFERVSRQSMMSKEELVREDVMRRVEEERQELIKNHSLNKMTEAAQSGGFHTITPQITSCAMSALESFQTIPPSLPNIGKWIAIQLTFDPQQQIILDIPVTKSIPLDQPFPINKDVPGVYFLSFLRDNEKIQTGQITYFPPGTSPKMKMVYASVITSVKKKIAKTTFTLTADDGKSIGFQDILEIIQPVVESSTSSSTSAPSSLGSAGFSRPKPARPKMVSKSVFISVDAGSGSTSSASSRVPVFPMAQSTISPTSAAAVAGTKARRSSDSANGEDGVKTPNAPPPTPATASPTSPPQFTSSSSSKLDFDRVRPKSEIVLSPSGSKSGREDDDSLIGSPGASAEEHHRPLSDQLFAKMRIYDNHCDDNQWAEEGDLKGNFARHLQHHHHQQHNIITETERKNTGDGYSSDEATLDSRMRY